MPSLIEGEGEVGDSCRNMIELHGRPGRCRNNEDWNIARSKTLAEQAWSEWLRQPWARPSVYLLMLRPTWFCLQHTHQSSIIQVSFQHWTIEHSFLFSFEEMMFALELHQQSRRLSKWMCCCCCCGSPGNTGLYCKPLQTNNHFDQFVFSWPSLS